MPHERGASRPKGLRPGPGSAHRKPDRRRAGRGCRAKRTGLGAERLTPRAATVRTSAATLGMDSAAATLRPEIRSVSAVAGSNVAEPVLVMRSWRTSTADTQSAILSQRRSIQVHYRPSSVSMTSSLEPAPSLPAGQPGGAGRPGPRRCPAGVPWATGLFLLPPSSLARPADNALLHSSQRVGSGAPSRW